MSGKFLLDTNIVIALFKKDKKVQSALKKAAEVFVPAIVLGELYYGAQKSGQVEKNMKQVSEFATAASVLACDAKTAEHYGDIKNKLQAKGKPLPENDIWIAALADQFALTVVTRDQHFKKIDGLQLEEW